MAPFTKTRREVEEVITIIKNDGKRNISAAARKLKVLYTLLTHYLRGRKSAI